jgi:phenol hydroxylase P5 protein
LNRSAHRGRGGPDHPRRRLRAGIYLPHACCHGLCATCKVQVTDGEVDHGEASTFALMDFEREEGKCLACCATPSPTW